jgi:hypothetical protein
MFEILIASSAFVVAILTASSIILSDTDDNKFIYAVILSYAILILSFLFVELTFLASFFASSNASIFSFNDFKISSFVKVKFIDKFLYFFLTISISNNISLSNSLSFLYNSEINFKLSFKTTSFSFLIFSNVLLASSTSFSAFSNSFLASSSFF